MAALISCSVQETGEDILGEDILVDDSYSIQINGVLDDATKSYISVDGSVFTSSWSYHDEILVTVDTDYSNKKTFTNQSADGAAANFTGTIKNVAAGEHSLHAFKSPANSNNKDGTFGFDVATSQTIPNLNTFDSAADILVAKSVNVSLGAVSDITSVDMNFRRAAAIVKIIPVDATTESLLSSAKVTGMTIASDKDNIAGRIKCSVIDHTAADAVSSKSKSITVSYAGSDFSINGSNGAYVIMAPVKLSKNSVLTVSLTTDDATLTISRDITIPSDISLDANAVQPLRISFYDSDVAVVIPDPEINADNVNITASDESGTITYSIANPAVDGVLTKEVLAGATIGNLSVGDPSGGTIAFTCDENLETSPKSATVRLTYSYNSGSDSVTKDVTITQASAGLQYYLWDLQAWAKTSSSITADYYYYDSGSDAFVESATASVNDRLYFKKALAVASGGGFYYANMSSGGDTYAIVIPTTKKGTLSVWATLNKKSSETGSATINMKYGSEDAQTASLSTSNGDYYDTSAALCGAKKYDFSIDGTQSLIQVYKSGSNGIRIYKVEFQETD